MKRLALLTVIFLAARPEKPSLLVMISVDQS